MVRTHGRYTRRRQHVRGWCRSLACGIALFGAAALMPQQVHAGGRMTDAQITDAAADAMFTKHGVPGYIIDVATSNGIVTLSGTVNNIMAKERATRIVETVKGVRGVVNRIEVADSGKSDAEILDHVEDAFLMDAATDSWEIDTVVDDGIVTLRGTVDSWQERELAEKVAKTIRGVRGVDNLVDVKPDARRSDSEIRSEIVAALRWNALVDDALIDVKVDDGEVALSGTVGSAAERRQARIDCWVAGVTSVTSDNLEVDSWARDDRFRKEKYVVKSDNKVRGAVQDALLYDPRVASFNVLVSAQNGVVTLRGTVDNLKAKNSAAHTARNVVGVWRVKNRIAVRPATPSDATVAQHIRTALMRNPYVDRFEVEVSVDNHKANLAGTVDTYFEKFQAEATASEIYGVVEINNNLSVDADYDKLTYNPYVDDDWYVYDYGWYVYPDSYTTAKNDWEIRQDIREELEWSPFVDSDDISIHVDDGAATLTGAVETWNERSAATENALEGGAVAVDNDITVQFGPEYYQQ